jgi:hypothetical protein
MKEWSFYFQKLPLVESNDFCHQKVFCSKTSQTVPNRYRRRRKSYRRYVSVDKDVVINNKTQIFYVCVLLFM